MSKRGWQRRASQKLAYARWHLGWSETLCENAQQRDALLESAVWHASGAYLAFLQEMVRDEHMLPDLAVSEVTDAVSLSRCYTDYLPAALSECANLESQPGWLRELLDWAALAQRCTDEPPNASVALISVASAGVPNASALSEVLDALEQLIERLRGEMLEF